MLHAIFPSDSPSADNPNVWWRFQIIDLLVMLFSPLTFFYPSLSVSFLPPKGLVKIDMLKKNSRWYYDFGGFNPYVFRSKPGCKCEMPNLHLEGGNKVYFILKVHRLEIIVLCMFVIHGIRIVHTVLLTASLNTAVFEGRSRQIQNFYAVNLMWSSKDERTLCISSEMKWKTKGNTERRLSSWGLFDCVSSSWNNLKCQLDATR